MTYWPAALFAVVWIWADLIGDLLSVISTYFYFGWEPDPTRVPKIFLIALLAFSGPIFYRLGLRRWKPQRVNRILLPLLFGLYLLLSLDHQSSFFAWTTVLAVWVGGLAMMSLLSDLNQTKLPTLSLYALHVAFLFYLSIRVAQAGLPLYLAPFSGMTALHWGILLVAVLLGMFLPAAAPSAQSEPSAQSNSVNAKPSRWAGSIGVVFGLLTGLSVGLIYNLNIWSAGTPRALPAAYFLSMGLGFLAGWGLLRVARAAYYLLLPSAGLALAASLYILLNRPYDLMLGLLLHGLGCAGLFLLWAYFLERLQAYLRRQANFFPWLSYQLGFVALLLILAVFLLKSNPNGFWLALVLSLGILSAHEFFQRRDALPQPELMRLWLYTGGVFALMGLGSAFVPRPVNSTQGAPQASATGAATELHLLSSNIRYGWTDDYRFKPNEQVAFLAQQHPDLMGLQEVNKGHTSGAYSDLFSYYQKHLPGQWFYGDANYGFGNALMSRLPVESVELRPYTAHDMLRRSCLVAKVRFQGQSIRVFVTHLSHLPPPNPVRVAQMNELLSWIKASAEPWVLMADLNAEPGDPEVQALTALAHPIFRRGDWLSKMSFPSLQPNRRIDYIVFSSQFQPQEQRILDNHGASDHRPVTVTLKLPLSAAAQPESISQSAQKEKGK